jgi:farnesyl-diphosphate farnesyltransferase
MKENVEKKATPADEAYQDLILQGVSRTFALTIPELPPPLARVVANAYLLCRIADTIEDDKHLPFDEKRRLSERFIKVVAAQDSAESFAADLYPRLSPTATAEEHDLIKNTAAVIRITHSFNSRQQAALERCIRIMADGMSRYQEENVRDGLKDQEDMDNYCYFVAGVVGEMLTELFCDYSAEIDRHRDELMALAVSFGQGLQMTNILKDIWDDRKRGMCWLPRDVFMRFGSDLTAISSAGDDGQFQQALGHLIGVARSHLANALQYTLLIPKEEQGLRRFCLWAIGMAILTLRKINTNRAFQSGQEVKISRNSVKATILSTNLLTRHDALLRLLFRLTAKPLPRVELSGQFSGLAGEV